GRLGNRRIGRTDSDPDDSVLRFGLDDVDDDVDVPRAEVPMGSLADFQNSIYLQGLGDVRPALPTDLTKLEGLAERSLSMQAFGYVAGSAGTEATARANREAFDRWRIVPR